MVVVTSKLVKRVVFLGIKTSQRSFHGSSPQLYTPKNVLILGSSGCLGSITANYLSREYGMTIIGADIVESRNKASRIDHFIPLPKGPGGSSPSLSDLTTTLTNELENIMYHSKDGNQKIDAIICASGGFESDPPINYSKGIDNNNNKILDPAQIYCDTFERMIQMNLYPVAAAGYAAQNFMANQGLFVVVGATAALSAIPGSLAYGVSKAAVHHYVQSFGSITGKALSTKTQRKLARTLRQDAECLDDMTIAGILPTTIDTPSNRAAMPHAVPSKWTDPKDIAIEIGRWIDEPHLRPHSGSLIKVISDASSSTDTDTDTDTKREPAVFQIAR